MVGGGIKEPRLVGRGEAGGGVGERGGGEDKTREKRKKKECRTTNLK